MINNEVIENWLKVEPEINKNRSREILNELVESMKYVYASPRELSESEIIELCEEYKKVEYLINTTNAFRVKEYDQYIAYSNFVDKYSDLSSTLDLNYLRFVNGYIDDQFKIKGKFRFIIRSFFYHQEYEERHLILSKLKRIQQQIYSKYRIDYENVKRLFQEIDEMFWLHPAIWPCINHLNYWHKFYLPYIVKERTMLKEVENL